jgi:hypothetical protein
MSPVLTAGAQPDIDRELHVVRGSHDAKALPDQYFTAPILAPEWPA